MSSDNGRSVWTWPSRLIASVLIAAIRGYQRFISPLSGPSCRYYPTCSAYGVKALQVHGAGKGTLMTAWRILRCNPFSKGGVDPVPARGHWHPSVRPDGTPRQSHTGDAPNDAAVMNSATIRENDLVGSEPTSTAPDEQAAPDPDTAASRPSDLLSNAANARLVAQVTTPDPDTDGPAPSGPGQENA